MGGRASGAATRASSAEDSTHQFAGYQRVLVQDSTIIKLPPHLFEKFSGVSNAHSKVCNARVQATYDLLVLRLIDFSIDPYSKNDLQAAPELSTRPRPYPLWAVLRTGSPGCPNRPGACSSA